jgi:hypothetical protein
MKFAAVHLGLLFACLGLVSGTLLNVFLKDNNDHNNSGSLVPAMASEIQEGFAM